MEKHGSIQRHKTLSRKQQGVDIDSLYRPLLNHQLTESDDQFLQGCQIHWLSSADSAKGLKDFSPFDEAPR
jgi:hypothetical protein